MDSLSADNSLFANCQHQIFWAIRHLVSSKTFCANVDTWPQAFQVAGGERVAPGTGWHLSDDTCPRGDGGRLLTSGDAELPLLLWKEGTLCWVMSKEAEV